MGVVVFKTIAENIRSFVQKEEELLKEPKQVPDAASEVFENSAQEPAPQRIVEKPLPASASPVQERPRRSLPFSSAELHSALQQQQADTHHGASQQAAPHQTQQSAPVYPPVQYASPAPHARSQYDDTQEVEIADDIAAFEEAVGAISDEHVRTAAEYLDERSVNRPRARSAAPARAAPLRDGFFSNFEEFLFEKGVPDMKKLDGDLINKMRLFHERKREGKEPFLHANDVTDALRRRLGELQILENEWYSRYQESKDVERAMLHLESDIDEKTRALRELLKESHFYSLLSKEVPPDRAFVLPDGKRVTSLSALRHAVARMDEISFSQHVDPAENRNDFADWVRFVFEDHDLAYRVRQCTTRSQMIAVLSSPHRGE